MINFEIKTDFINLLQFLKLIGVISTGGEITHYLSLNVVKINGIECKIKRKKLFNGDIIELPNNKTYKIINLNNK